MKHFFLFLLIGITGPVVNKILAQGNYSMLTVKMSFSYTKTTTGKSSSTVIVTGNNNNAPMVKSASGNITVYTKNFLLGGSSIKSDQIIQMPVGVPSALNDPTNAKFFLLADQDHGLHGTMSYSRSGEKLKGLPDISFIFTYDAGNKLANIGVGGVSASIQTVTDEGETRIYESTVSGGVGATTDISKSLYGYEGMQKDPNTAYLQLTKTKTGYRISYSKKSKETDGNGKTTGINTEDLIAFIGEPDDVYEAAITAYHCDYEHWLPTGPTVDGKADKTGDVSLQFAVDVYMKGHPSYKYPGKLNISWHLGNVTNYPGFCNNYPAYTNSPDITPDLIFNPDMKQNAAFIAVNNTDAVANKVFSGDGVAKIMCMDYASWGKLSAVITLDNGTAINAVSYAEPGKQYLTIPLDKDENKLADAWEKDNNKEKHPLTWDEDAEPSEQRENGDGYTLFEEYRGFAIHINADQEKQITAREDFLRTAPNKKDAFVYDKDDLFKDNYETENPSGVEWHYLSNEKKQFLYYPDDIKKDGSRWINFNKVSDYFYSEQYCMVLMYSDRTYAYDPKMTACSFTKAEYDFANNPHPTPADSIAYNEGTSETYSTKSPMKRILKIEILRNAIAKKLAFVKQTAGDAVFAAAVKTKIASAVKHEVGHCIGIHHHEALAGAPDNDNHDEQSAAANNGVISCLMRYYDLAESNNVQQQLVVRNSYCRKGESGPYYYRVNTRDANGKVVSYTEQVAGTKVSDNCYGQITVKSNPGD
jgi:hypothetical protein